MVAIQTMFALAMAMVATAAPSIQSRGSVNTNLVFFRIDDSSCDPGTQLSPTITVFNPPLTTGQNYTTNTCYPYQAWGSVHVENLQAGCTSTPGVLRLRLCDYSGWLNLDTRHMSQGSWT
ncbi:hypothetical protein L207DRAFT_582350 [Hyaloscypha variabilis F]|uniref:Cyanovirin-N domain-containing protein n=1 Tax=Hyaloscypha variabilis (strain UAMH 11265 / GT02V1 / F) TaxID=1149755 RepID=A0A2J6RTT5_HYAVF|nr:hypothetical protein L207DRAFT_582350 [Hyaloscypha variabilis F]